MVIKCPNPKFNRMAMKRCYVNFMRNLSMELRDEAKIYWQNRSMSISGVIEVQGSMQCLLQSFCSLRYMRDLTSTDSSKPNYIWYKHWTISALCILKKTEHFFISDGVSVHVLIKLVDMLDWLKMHELFNNVYETYLIIKITLS